MSATYEIHRSTLGLPPIRRLPARPMSEAPPAQVLVLHDLETDEAALQRAMEWARSRKRTSVGRVAREDDDG